MRPPAHCGTGDAPGSWQNSRGGTSSAGTRITLYVVFMNSHDGNGAIKAAIMPIRIVSQNNGMRS